MSEFNQHKPIYLQIADNVCERILGGEYLQEERIPSVRELGMNLGVNPNTIMRTYEYLQSMNIIFTSRGMGYFVSADAKTKILDMQRDEFLTEELPNFMKKMKLLQFTPEDICKKIKNF
jgi:DNA-binding transcriptional regulator YhcF (GntR family)